MVTQFYSLWHNSFDARGFPWIQHVVAGRRKGRLLCPVCETRESDTATGNIRVELMPNKGVMWPAILGSGATLSPLIIADYVLDDWEVGRRPRRLVARKEAIPLLLKVMTPLLMLVPWHPATMCRIVNVEPCVLKLFSVLSR